MAKFPEPPTSEALGSIEPVPTTLAAGSMLVRIFFAGGPYPSAWNRFRHFGPTASRFDHHEPDEAYPSVNGLHYCSSMYGNAPAIALFERAANRLPDRPVMHRELRDPALANVVIETAARIRYRIA